MDYVIIPDTAVIEINCSKKDNESSNIVYRDKYGELHSIDFNICAVNYKAQHENALNYCIGERKIDESYFVFYTSGVKTKIVFRDLYVGNLFRYHRLSGRRSVRFIEMQNLISKSGYTTRDMS